MAFVTIIDEGTKKERYKVVYDLPVLPGQKRKRESRTFPTGTKKKDVMDFVKLKEAEKLNMNPINNHNLLVSDAIETYLNRYCINLAHNTMKGYRSIYLREHGLKEYFGNMKLKQIDTNAVQAYITYLHNLGSSPKTISNTIGFLSKVMNHYVLQQYINRNPVSGTSLPKQKRNREVKAYTPEQLQTLLTLSKEKPYLHTTIALGGLAGLRRGEIAALTWDDVNLGDEPSIRINKTKYHVEHKTGRPDDTGIKEPKTASGIRTIPIPDTLAKILRQDKVRYNKCKLRCGTAFKDSNCVVFQKDGSDYDVNTLSNQYRVFVKAHPEIPYCTLHQLRHTFASILASANTPIKDVQEMLGHSDISTTMNVYTHGFSASKRSAVTELNRLISG